LYDYITTQLLFKFSLSLSLEVLSRRDILYLLLFLSPASKFHLQNTSKISPAAA